MRVPPRSASQEEAPHEPACPEGRGDTAGPLSRESGREAQAEESARESEAAESDAAELLGENAMPAGRLSSRGERAAEDMAPSEGLEAYEGQSEPCASVPCTEPQEHAHLVFN